MMTESSKLPSEFSPWRWGATILAFPAFQAVLMAIDWLLRDSTRPMVGGIHDTFMMTIQWGSLGLFFIALCMWMPRSWPLWGRALLAIVQTVVAFFLLVFSWLYYILSNGIDTL